MKLTRNRSSRMFAAAGAALALAACDSAPAPVAPSSPDAPPTPAQAPAERPPAKPAAAPFPTFVDVAEEAGVATMNHTGKPAKKDWIVSGMGAAAIAFDYDRDGDMDLCVVDGTMLTDQGVLEYLDEARTRLFRNEGGMKFTEVTKAAGIDLQAFGFGGAAGDVDGDGWPDLYICCWGRNRLYRNRGDGTFEDITDRADVAGGDWEMTTSCALGDVNGDGILDIYAANYSDQKAYIDECRKAGIGGRNATWRGHKVYVGPAGLTGQLDRLWIGRGDGTFSDESKARLRNQKAYYGFSPVMTDVDNDGDLDIFVANDTQSNHLWVNDGKGVFEDLALQAGVAMNRDMLEQACMGVDAADYDRDGWLDLTVTNFSHDYNTIYLNKTGRTRRPDGSRVISFTDSTHAVGLAQPSYFRLSWGVKFVDFDLDGWLDYFTACGHVYGEMDDFEKTTQTSYAQRCQVLRNDGTTARMLRDVTDDAGPAFGLKRVWRGATFADFDDDGDEDVWVGALNGKAALFRNDGGNRNSFLRFRLDGKKPLTTPAGARVLVTMADGSVQVRELHYGDSFCGDNDPRFFFGLGAEPAARKVVIQWPGGTSHEFRDVAGRRAYVIRQDDGTLTEEKLSGR
ncbi:MAG: hypothetical protein HMLKMBBP_00165 [Planctomycetes bacterium]|nr:hypothetical protein [Planctomycetota bacterium]